MKYSSGNYSPGSPEGRHVLYQLPGRSQGKHNSRRPLKTSLSTRSFFSDIRFCTLYRPKTKMKVKIVVGNTGTVLSQHLFIVESYTSAYHKKTILNTFCLLSVSQSTLNKQNFDKKKNFCVRRRCTSQIYT